jgi:protein-S-isoprenylcysteine O-methyltransferase Ste14
MSAIPAFEIGVWNAWIFMLIYGLPVPILMSIHKGVLEESLKQYSKTQKQANYIMWAIWAVVSIYSIFLPMRLGTLWFYVGLPIAATGAVTYITVIVTFATNPIDKEPATTGIYRFSRHPMYITQSVMFIGAGIASASWLFLLLSIIYSIMYFANAGTEEDILLEKYGDSYREYVNRTPRWIGIPRY